MPFDSSILQVGTGAWSIFVLAVLGAALLVVVAYLRMRPMLHTPKILGKYESKPAAIATPAPSIEYAVRAPTGVSTSQIEVTADKTELLQMKSRWEQLVTEAESNESLTTEQRQTFVEEGRKRIAEIDQRMAQII